MDKVEEETPSLSPTQLLQVAESHLRRRNFSLCRHYAAQSHHPSAASLTAISDILLASSSSTNFTNWYSILQIDTFSNDHFLIRSHFKKLLFLLDPINDQTPFANEALDFLWKAYNCLSNPDSKSHFDSQLTLLFSNQKHVNGCRFDDDCGQNQGSFWTFCPYCFHVYLYDRVYEGCCLRCNNEACRRAFHGVCLSSLHRMELDKGEYFSCFGYFPLGFSPIEGDEKGKFESWSPIVGLFPVRRIGKTCAGRVDSKGGDDFIEILDDENDESESRGENASSGGNVGKPQMMRRKTVAWNAKKLRSKRKRSIRKCVDGLGERLDLDDENDDDDGVNGFQNKNNVDGGSGWVRENMNLFGDDDEVWT